MTNPRDFLPSKYKKDQAPDNFNDSTDLSRSPWSDLAKKPEVPEYRSAIELPKDEYSVEMADETEEKTESSFDKNQITTSFKPKRKANSKIAGILVVFFLVIGVFSSYLLSQQNQDNRQQASGGDSCVSGEPYCQCVGNYNGSQQDNCHIVMPTATPSPSGTVSCGSGTTAHEGRCYPNLCWQGSMFICDPNSTITPTPGPGNSCPSIGSYDYEYNANTGKCQRVWENDNHCGGGCGNQTCVPGGVGGLSDWHCTTCAAGWVGVDGVGCVQPTKPPCSGDDCNPTAPPTAPPTTVTQPPTVTTTAPGPVCSNIEMLNSTGTAMTGDDDKSLKNGDQVKFRATATNVSSTILTFEFRIWAPNMSSWVNITNKDAHSGAANVSATYTIINSGRHVVQSRICVSGVCQAWETVTGAPADTKDTANCTADTDCASGYYCYIDPTPSGAQTLVAPTGNYCKVKIEANKSACKLTCPTGQECYMPYTPSGAQTFAEVTPACRVIPTVTNSNTSTTLGKNCTAVTDCSGTEVCYQPPMPGCSNNPNSGACIQVMPPAVCTNRCNSNNECGSNQVCSSVPAGGCASGQACASVPICRIAVGIACQTDAQCFTGYKCDTASGGCQILNTKTIQDKNAVDATK